MMKVYEYEDDIVYLYLILVYILLFYIYNCTI
jgi:hypothetical protein